ncbi:DUF4446 family protein [Wansuia hejianensis]|uniref:DUF4446 family protein n=1 Tax=Wansuia hejianensis TaxID=2763667 RepID=A0A926IMR5_9FIRM|nr:DUF4446 family protein [Wansuia hejianensis]MBC8590896.1 DUF4446 family protein [Wansuia hejianensis]
MEDIKLLINYYNTEIIIGLFLGFIFLFLLLLISSHKTRKSVQRYKQLVQGSSGASMEELLFNIQQNIKKTNQDMEKINKDIEETKTRLSFAIQKVGFIRYNAFDDMGSDLSFSVALLDDFKNGFVITSIYGRENTVNYGKPIKDGTSRIPLSAEEMIAIDRALRGEVEIKDIS